MKWDQVDELHADPGVAPGDRNFSAVKRRHTVWWSAILVVFAAGLFGGVLWVAYPSHESDGSGSPPLVKADPGPVKVKPDQPGGQEIPFQNSTVYDRLGQNGPNGQKPQVEKLLPPPEAPVQRAPPAPTPPADSAAAPPAPTPAPEAASAPLPPPHLSEEQFAALQRGADVASPTALAPKPGPSAQAVPPAEKPPVVAMVVPPQIVVPIVPKAGGDGTFRIQIGSVPTADAVNTEWSRLKERFPQTLNTLKMSAEKIELPGKGIFYRIQAGPLDEGKAKSACDRLKAQGAGCIVVKS